MTMLFYSTSPVKHFQQSQAPMTDTKYYLVMYGVFFTDGTPKHHKGCQLCKIWHFKGTQLKNLATVRH